MSPSKVDLLSTRVEALERDVKDLRSNRRDDSAKMDKLIEAVASLNGRVAGYLVAGMVLAAGVSMALSQIMKGH